MSGWVRGYRGTSLWPFVASQHVVRPRKKELHHVRHGGQNGEALNEAATVQIAPYSFFSTVCHFGSRQRPGRPVAYITCSSVCVCAFLLNLSKF